MTHPRTYQHGIKAFLDAKPLSGNPYDRSVNLEAYEAWNGGWLDANRSRWRRHTLEIAARRYAKASLFPGYHFA